MFSHILIAHDLSLESDIALQRAAQLANQHHARLTLLHVVEGHPDSKALAELQAAAERVLGERLAAYSHCQADVVLRSGQAAQVTLEVASDIGADLLVVGGHHKGRPELFSGTNLERLARHCGMPLLLARCEQVAPYQRAIVALDQSLCGCQALRSAVCLIPSDAELLGINIFDSSGRRDARQAGEQLEIQQGLLQHMVEDECDQLPARQKPVRVEVIPGTLAGSLDERIREERPQLLALGQHSRSRLSEALLGSLPIHYLRQPPCDVLLVK